MTATHPNNRLLILTSTLPRFINDNQPAFVLDFAINLSTEYEVYVLAPHDKGAKYIEHIDNVTIYRFPYFLPGYETLAYRGGMINVFKKSILGKIQLPLFLISELIFTIYLLLAKRIDIINAHWLFPQGFIGHIAKMITGKKLIITTHGGDVAILKNKRIAKILKPALRAADQVTFVSTINLNIAKSLASLSETRRLHVLPMGIPIPHAIANNSVKQIISIPLDIVFVGRLVEIKGINYLIDAINILNRDNIPVKLSIFGEGPLRTELESRVKKIKLNDHISFYGYANVEQKERAYASADIVVVPSIRDEHGHEEGLPVVAIEAMSYGKLLIATNTGSLSELVENNVNGILVEHSNSGAIADAIKHSLSNYEETKKLKKAALETSELYYWHRIIKKFCILAKK